MFRKKKEGWFLKTFFAMCISGFFYRTARRFLKSVEKEPGVKKKLEKKSCRKGSIKNKR